MKSLRLPVCVFYGVDARTRDLDRNEPYKPRRLTNIGFAVRRPLRLGRVVIRYNGRQHTQAITNAPIQVFQIP